MRNKSENSGTRPPLQATRLLDQLRERLRYLHYSLRTEQAYVYWARAFIRWSGMRHPRDLGKTDVEAYLSMLANERSVSPSTHRQALSAILFIYKEVLSQELPWLDEIGRPPVRKRIPVVLTADEVAAILARMVGVESLLAQLLYGTGLRLQEGLSLRIKDLDFARRLIVVREGKGGKDRVVMMPLAIMHDLRVQVDQSRTLWHADRQAGRPGVFLPHALAAKYPRAAVSFTWHWVFASPSLSTDPRGGIERRHRLYEERLAHHLKLSMYALTQNKRLPKSGNKTYCAATGLRV